MSEKIITGVKGEDLAAGFLKQKGFEVVRRNYRYKHAEIDLIVQRENWLVFVEVKTRSSTDFGEPETFVDNKKASKIIWGAEHYIFDNDWHGNIRFDIVSVKVGPLSEITHIEDAFY